MEKSQKCNKYENQSKVLSIKLFHPYYLLISDSQSESTKPKDMLSFYLVVLISILKRTTVLLLFTKTKSSLVHFSFQTFSECKPLIKQEFVKTVKLEKYALSDY